MEEDSPKEDLLNSNYSDISNEKIVNLIANSPIHFKSNSKNIPE